MPAPTSRILCGLFVATLLWPGAAHAADQDTVSLFKIVTVRDEITLGLVADPSGGTAPTLEQVASRLAGGGHLIGWQYGTGRAADGSLRQLALRQVAVYGANIVRVETMKAEQPVEAPPKR